MELRALILAIAAPALMALTGLWLVWRRRADHWPDPRPAYTSGLLLVLWVGAMVAGFGVGGWPPASGPERLPYAILGLAVLGAAAGWSRRWEPWAGGAACLGAFAVIAWSLVARAWPWPMTLAWVGLPAVLAGLGTAPLGGAGRARGAWVPSVFFVVVVMAAVTLVLTGHITTTLRAGAVAACVGPAMVVGAARRAFSFGPVLGVLARSLLALLYFAVVLGETPRACALLILGAVAALGLLSPREADGRGVRSCRRGLALAAVPCGLAVGAVVVALLNQPSEA